MKRMKKHEFNHEIELLHKCNNLLLPLYFSYSIVGGFFPIFFVFYPSLSSLLSHIPYLFYFSLSHVLQPSATRARLANVRKCAFFLLLYFIQCDLICMNPAARTSTESFTNFNLLEECVCVSVSEFAVCQFYSNAVHNRTQVCILCMSAAAVQNYT